MQNSAGFLPWKWGIPIAIFSHQKLGENSVWRAMMHLRQSTAGFLPQKYGEMLPNFRRGNLAITSNTLGKHWSGPHPFQNQTLKPNTFKALKANANSLFSIGNVPKLWFYQNKRLSLDRRCGVPNTFPTCNKANKIKNQDFLPIHIRLGKMIFFFT